MSFSKYQISVGGSQTTFKCVSKVTGLVYHPDESWEPMEKTLSSICCSALLGNDIPVLELELVLRFSLLPSNTSETEITII